MAGRGAPVPLATTKLKNAVDGKPVSIADVKGKAGTLVVFTCNHCPFAQGWEQRIVALGNEYAKKGIGVILINANDPAEHAVDGWPGPRAGQGRRHAVPLRRRRDVGGGQGFGAAKTPEAFLFDKNGKLAYHGAIDDNARARQGREALSERRARRGRRRQGPARPETKGIGCSIKLRG